MSNEIISFPLEVTVTKDDVEKGKQHHCIECPIALALKRVTDLTWYVTLERAWTNIDSVYFIAQLPKIAQFFIFTFDAKQDIELITFCLSEITITDSMEFDYE